MQELPLRYNWLMAFLLDSKEGLTRDELVGRTKIARTTLYDWLAWLRKRGFVGRSRNYIPRRGRPKVRWYLTLKGERYVRGEL